jgi:hypothetical protein
MIESGLMKCHTGIHFLARYNTSRNVEQTLDFSRNPREKSGAIHARCRRLKCSVKVEAFQLARGMMQEREVKPHDHSDYL